MLNNKMCSWNSTDDTSKAADGISLGDLIFMVEKLSRTQLVSLAGS